MCPQILKCQHVIRGGVDNSEQSERGKKSRQRLCRLSVIQSPISHLGKLPLRPYLIPRASELCHLHFLAATGGEPSFVIVGKGCNLTLEPQDSYPQGVCKRLEGGRCGPGFVTLRMACASAAAPGTELRAESGWEGRTEKICAGA